MSSLSLLQIALYLFLLLLCVKPLGGYMAQVYQGRVRFLSFLERFIYRFCSITPEQEMNWKAYLGAMLLLNFLGFLAVYLLQRVQIFLPFNPQHFQNVSPTIAFNTAISFVSNTDWQVYSGENSLSYLTQMLSLTVQNFLSAATGISLLVALTRGLSRRETTQLGNFWVDMVRGILYILLPLSLLFAFVLASQGVIQTFKPTQTVTLLQQVSDTHSTIPISLEGAGFVSFSEMHKTGGILRGDERFIQPPLNSNRIYRSSQIAFIPSNKKNQIFKYERYRTEQRIPMGPVASQIAIKQLGTNGGGFFNANSAHPFENPTPLTNFLELFAILLIPTALCYTFGSMVNDKRQGWAILAAMLLIFIPFTCLSVVAEQQGNPLFAQLGLSTSAENNLPSFSNLEGKEMRFGVTTSALWATATTASSNGSVNAMHDSFMPLGGLAPLWLMHIGEVAFGGVGSGLYGMLMLVIITVFVAGLMVGRTPEYLGKKIEPYEMKMASVAVLVMPLSVLIFTAIAISTTAGRSAIANPGVHGFTEILYAFTSLVNNNGSAFAGLNASSPFYTVLGGVAMLIGRYWIAIPTLALAGALAQKKMIPSNQGTLETHSFLFVLLLVSVTFVLGALTFFPALALGPIVEQLLLSSS